MKNNLLSASILGFGLIVAFLIVTDGAFAQTTLDTIQFPIAELGNCKDKSTCKTYCDDADHTDACLAFAEKNNLMSKEEIDVAKKFEASGNKGPGGCTGREACQNYCGDVNHIDDCVAFAEKTGMLPPKELAEAKQVQAAIAKGVKPPACNGKKECDAYCEDSSHMKECIAFGEAAGFIKGKDLEDAKKMMTAVENGATPPACKGKEACDAYCSDASHIEECMTFAQAAGLMSPEEAQNSQKMIDAVKKGFKPPACKGKEECDAYCSEPTHTDECINFSIAAGFMDEKQAEMARKTGGKGPGGCVGKDACDTFCGDQANQQICMDFAKENGFDVGPDGQDDRQQGQGPGQNQDRQGQINEQLQPWKDMCSDNTELACADDAGKFVADAKIGADKQPVCPTGSTAKCGNYPQIRQQGQNQQNQKQQGQSRNKFQSGPGIVNPGGQRMPQQAGPGGCKGPEACAAYCKDHQQECKEFIPSGGGPNEDRGFNPGSGQNGNGPSLNRDGANQQQQKQQQNQQKPGEQYGPRTYPNQPPPEGTSGAGLNQSPSNEQFAPGVQSMAPPPGSTVSPQYPVPSTESVGTGGTIVPETPVPQIQPIEQTAPQSFLSNLKSSLASVVTSVEEFLF
ncbi:MAG: hypothetical protein Q8L52_01270 [bacterium]|nr:hypothetical protein [bacterium]